MAQTPSSMVALGNAAPSFSLEDTEGRLVTLEQFADAPALVVVFLCNHCPFVKHIRAGLAAFSRDYQAKGLAMVGINSNDVVSYPEDRPEKMAEEKRAAGYRFPYLFDETQSVARAYGAACTPDFFLYDRARKLVYRGQFDDSRPSNGQPITGADLRAAADAVLQGRPVFADQKPSIGCNIKWKAGPPLVTNPASRDGVGLP
jgi:peroxiredoxin